MRRINIKSDLALGDHLVMEMAIWSLHTQFPNQYITSAEIPQNTLYNNHPFISPKADGETIQMHYPWVHKSNEKANSFADAYIDYLGEKLEIPLKLQTNKPHIYLSDAEKNKYKELTPYWIIVCGGKADFTTKHLPLHTLQPVVDYFCGDIRFVQPIKKEHVHYPLKNVQLISKMDIRDMISLVYNCQGVICPVTGWHHLAGALDKPCIVIGGGREPASWIQQYQKQHLLHSVGMLDCCKDKACWKSRVIELGDKSEGDKSLCVHPEFASDQWVPRCLLNIKPQEIISLVERFK